MVGEGVTPLAATTEPRVIVSHHGALQSHEPLSQVLLGSGYSPLELGTCAVRVGLASGLQYARTPCIH